MMSEADAMRAGRFKIRSSSARGSHRGSGAHGRDVGCGPAGGVSAEEHALVVYEERFHGMGALITLPDPFSGAWI
jgi:hypothetical protein